MVAFTSKTIIEMQSKTFKNVVSIVSMFAFTGTYCKVNTIRLIIVINYSCVADLDVRLISFFMSNFLYCLSSMPI